MTNLFMLGLIDRFVEQLKEQKKSAFTIIAYKKDLQQFIGFLTSQDKNDIRDVKKEDITAFLKKILSENYTKKTASRKLNSIRTFFRYLKNQGIINQNPALEVSHPKYTQAPPRILSKMEYRALRDVAKEDPRTYAMVELLLQTGITIGELASLHLDDIKPDSLFVRSYGKNKERTIPLNQAAKKAVDQYLKTRGKSSSDFLFITRTGRPILVRNIRQIVMRCFSEVGIENATVNDLRSTFIAQQLASGASLEYIAKIVGHRRVSSTERYLSLVKKGVEKKEKLEEL